MSFHHSAATRHLWSRRFIALAELGPALKLKSWPIRLWIKKHTEQLWWAAIVVCALACLLGWVKHERYLGATADPKDLSAIMAKDSCMNWTLRDRFANKPDPVTNGQVEGVADECVVFWKKQDALTAQRQVLTPNK